MEGIEIIQKKASLAFCPLDPVNKGTTSELSLT